MGSSCFFSRHLKTRKVLRLLVCLPATVSCSCLCCRATPPSLSADQSLGRLLLAGGGGAARRRENRVFQCVTPPTWPRLPPAGLYEAHSSADKAEAGLMRLSRRQAGRRAGPEEALRARGRLQHCARRYKDCGLVADGAAEGAKCLEAPSKSQ